MRASLQYIYHPSNHQEHKPTSSSQQQQYYQESPSITNTNTSTSRNRTIKIKLLQSHPTLSIIAIVEDKGNIKLFDYSRNEIIHAFSYEFLQQLIMFGDNNYNYNLSTTKPNILLSKAKSNIEDNKKDNDDTIIKQSNTDSNIVNNSNAIRTISKSKNRPPRLNISASNEQAQYPYHISPSMIIGPSSSSPAAFRNNNTPTSSSFKKGSNTTHNILSGLKGIRFLDEHVLFWNSNNYRYNDSNASNHKQKGTMSSKLILYYEHHNNIILDLASYSIINTKKSLLLQKQLEQTCIAYALTYNVICIGYNDGCVRLYDIDQCIFLNHCIVPKVHNNNTTTTKKGSNNDDFIVQIISACRLPFQTTTTTTTKQNQEHNNNKDTNVTSCRFITLHSSGISYLWEFNVYATTSISSNKQQTNIDITHPTARMDKLLQTDEYNSNNNKEIIMYDYDRDILIGYLNDKKHLGVWDCSTMKRNQSGVPSYSPFLKVKIPYSYDTNDISTAGSTPTNDSNSNIDSLLSSIIIIPGIHPNTSDMTLSLWTSMTTTTTTTSSSSSVITNEINTGLFLTSLNSKEYMIKPDCIWNENLGLWLSSQNNDNKRYGNTTTANAGKTTIGGVSSTSTIKMRIYCMTVLRSKMMSMIVYGTNHGVFFISLEEDKELFPGSRHVSLEEDTGSILLMEGSSLFHANIDNYLYPSNPIGLLNIKDPSLVYTSSAPISASLSLQSKKSKDHTSIIRLPPRLLLSPSKNFLCMFWQSEYKYEIVRVDTLIPSITNNNNSSTPRNSKKNKNNNTIYTIDTNNNITSFAWIGSNDSYAILKAPSNYLKDNINNVKSQRRKNRRLTTKINKKIISKIKLPTPTSSSTKNATATATATATADVDHNDNPDRSSSVVVELKILFINDNNNNDIIKNDSKDSIRIVGTSSSGGIVGNNVLLSSSSSSPVLVKSLGNVPVRGGIPITLFGGPVLCIASMNLGAANNTIPTADGMAYFYSGRKTSSSSTLEGCKTIPASSYVSIGPSVPYPDLVVWSDDGKYCCIIIGTRIAIYYSNPPSFSFIGSTLSSSSLLSSSSDSIIESAKFLHGVLYCTSRTSVQCIFLGTCSDSFDTFVLASNDIPLLAPQQQQQSRYFPTCNIATSSSSSSPSYYSMLTPTPLTMSLNCPNVLNYYHGSLLISTSTGVYAISLDHPLLRIGILLSSNQTTRASPWFQVIHPMYYEALANFLQRRGHPQLSLQLSNHLSLDYLVSLSLKHHFTDTLESLYEHYGFHTIRKCKLDHNIVTLSNDHDDHRRSVIECIAAYFLSRGNVELVRRIISECIMHHNDDSNNADATNAINSRKEALFLSSLLYVIDEKDGQRLVKRAVGIAGANNANAATTSNIVGKDNYGDDTDIFLQWPIGKFVKDNLI